MAAKKKTKTTKKKSKIGKKKTAKKSASKKKTSATKNAKKKVTKRPPAAKKKATKEKAAKKKTTKKAATKKAAKKKAIKKKAAPKTTKTKRSSARTAGKAPVRGAKTPALERGGVIVTSGVSRTLKVRDAGPKVSRDSIKDGGSRVMVTSKVKGSGVASKSSGEQPEDALGKEKERKSLLGRLV